MHAAETMLCTSSAIPAADLFTLPHLQSDQPDLTASAFRRMGRAVTESVLRNRPPNYETMGPNLQRVADTVLWTSLASAVCFIGLSIFLGVLGIWLGVAVGIASLLQPISAQYLVRTGRLAAAMHMLVAWALIMMDCFLLTSGGIESSTSVWYAIVPGIALVLMPPRLRLPAVVLVILHQLALIALLSAGWYGSALRAAGELGNVPFDFIASALFAGCFGFGVSVAHRDMVRRLRHAERGARLAMRYVVSGFLVVDRAGKLVVDSSAGVEDWLPGARTGASLGEILARAQPAFAEEFRVRFESLVDGELPMALCLAQLPSRIRLNGRPHRLRYRAIQNEGAEWHRLIITLDDLSNQLARENAAAERQTLAALIRSLQHDPHATQRWVAESRRQVRALGQDPEADDWSDTLRALHEQAERVGLGALLHAIEEAESAAIGGARGYAATLVQRAWNELQTQYDELVEEDRFSGVRVGGDEYGQILRLIERRAPHEVLLSRALRWSPESTAAAIRTGEVATVSPPSGDQTAA